MTDSPTASHAAALGATGKRVPGKCRRDLIESACRGPRHYWPVQTQRTPNLSEAWGTLQYILRHQAHRRRVDAVVVARREVDHAVLELRPAPPIIITRTTHYGRFTMSGTGYTLDLRAVLGR
jgi:hypothetical protein